MRSASTKPWDGTASGCRIFHSCRSTPCMTHAFSPTRARPVSATLRWCMAKPSDERQSALTALLGLGNHSTRKSHYPELTVRLEELEKERNRYKWLFGHAVHGIFQASLQQGLLAANP